MKTEYREHPLGTPGLSARRKAQALAATNPVLRLIAGLFPGSRTEASSWQKGAEGEERVGRSLRKLSDRWMALHDRPLGDGGRNVDHLVIGPGGVFSLNTKNLSSNVVVTRTGFLIGGFPDGCVHIARDESERVSRRLTAAMGSLVEVRPVLVVLTPSLEVRAQPDGVSVIGASHVPKWFETQPEVIDAATAARIYRCARRNAVWTEPIAALQGDGV